MRTQCKTPTISTPTYFHDLNQSLRNKKVLSRKRETFLNTSYSKLSNNTKHHKCKLTEQQVREIRARSEENQRILGEEFGVSRHTITFILTGKSWSWLE